MTKGFEIGTMAGLTEESFKKVADFGLKVCQPSNWDETKWNDDVVKIVNESTSKYNVRIAGLWAGYPGPRVWNFTEGPTTLGLVPPEFREMRIKALKDAANFAKKVNAPAIITHVGFIPENPQDPEYEGTVAAIKAVAAHCNDIGIGFWFETGQETPVTLLRTIEDIDLPNLGINFDTANVVLYGKANPVDSLDVYGKYIRNLHAKDGLYPTNGMELGKEVPIGQGKANFPVLLKKLKDLGFTGEVIIEREIRGEQQNTDIKNSIDYLQKIIDEL